MVIVINFELHFMYEKLNSYDLCYCSYKSLMCPVLKTPVVENVLTVTKCSHWRHFHKQASLDRKSHHISIIVSELAVTVETIMI